MWTTKSFLDCLSKNETYLRSFIESVPSGIIVSNTMGEIILCNSKVEQMFKYNSEDLIGKQVEVLIPARLRDKHPSYRESFTKNPSKRLMGAGRELFGVCSDDTEIPVEVGLDHIKIESQTYIVVSIIDISDRKRSEERYKLFIESVQDYAIFMLDINGKVISWNEGAERVEGYKIDEIIGESVSQFYTEEDIQKNKPMRELEAAADLNRFETEAWRVRKDGSKFWGNIVITALRDTSGRLQGYGKVVRDLTERKKLDEKFQTIVESVPNGIIVVDANGKIVHHNTETLKMFGYNHNELIGQSIELLVPIRYRAEHSSTRKDYGKDPVKRQMGAGRDLTAQRKDGSEIPVEIGLNPMRTVEGSFVLASILDITERKRIETKLKNAFHQVQMRNEEMEQFVYTVSHDLKAPLVTSASFISFLREDIASQNYKEAQDSLDRLENANKRMKELINDLLDLSRVGRIALVLQKISIHSMVSDIIGNHEKVIQEKSIHVTLAENLPEIYADKQRFQQVLENLLTNAFKYASDVPHPKVEILWKETEREHQLCVKDNGPGIEAQYHKKIFKLFQRLETTKEGTGVGLTIVSRIVQLHGGRVWVESSLGNGAEFWVSLPKIPVNTEVLDE